MIGSISCCSLTFSFQISSQRATRLLYREATFIVLNNQPALRTIEGDRTKNSAVDSGFRTFIDASFHPINRCQIVAVRDTGTLLSLK